MQEGEPSFACLWGLQDPDMGPPAVGDACELVGSVSVPQQTMLWTCGISVQGDYNCGGGEEARASYHLPRRRMVLKLGDLGIFGSM